jgi:uncharacterized BrkB/YihY/UPF0761 family membrane protein
MSHKNETTLQKSLDAIDSMRKRIYATGWIVVVATLAMYARLTYLHRTTDNLERLLGASVTALTFLIAWAAFAIILTVTRTTKRILRAIEISMHPRDNRPEDK